MPLKIVWQFSDCCQGKREEIKLYSKYFLLFIVGIIVIKKHIIFSQKPDMHDHSESDCRVKIICRMNFFAEFCE